MKFGCRQCSLGPCYIEKDYFVALIDENGNVKKNIPPLDDMPNGLKAVPIECIPYLWHLFKVQIEEIYSKRIKDWSVV